MRNLLLFLLVFYNSLESHAQDMSPFFSAQQMWDEHAKTTTNSYSEHEKSEIAQFEVMKSRITKVWPDGLMPSKKIYVEYKKEDQARVVVDFEKGDVVAEMVVKGSPTKSELNELKMAFLSISQGSGHLLKPSEVVSEKNIQEGEISTNGKKVRVLRMSSRLSSDFIRNRVQAILPIVQEWAAKNKLAVPFVLAVIRQESSFNPRARSWVPAYGLMQIVPKYAGLEVMKTVTGRESEPSAETLYDSKSNIMFGTTYLHILRDQYFPEVLDPTKKMYLMIASYNWGPKRVQNLIKKGRIKISDPHIRILSQLSGCVPSETQGYLSAVTRYTEQFKKDGFN